MFNQAFKHVQDIFLLHKRHFTIDLRELRLPVSAQVLIPETFHNLHIPVVPRHHQQLLESLRRLRKGIKLSGIYP